MSLYVYVCDSENAPEDEDDLYAAVYGLEEEYAGGEIYEDLMRTEQQPPLVLQWVILTQPHACAEQIVLCRLKKIKVWNDYVKM